MPNDQTLRARAEAALNKKGAYGKDLELERFVPAQREHENYDDLTKAPEEYKRTMVDVGVLPNGQGRSGSLVYIDNAIVHNRTREQGLEIIPTLDALEKYDWLEKYSWKAVPVDKDKYTAKAYLENANGYFVRVKAGHKIDFPVQTCMMIDSDRRSQYTHNIIIVEEGGYLDIITGCATSPRANESLHLGISEIYLLEGAVLNFSMIHNWGPQTGVRPRTGVELGKDSRFVNNYVILRPAGSVQSYPTCYLNGEGASAKFNTISISHPGSELDLGSQVVLNAPKTAAEIVSRSITLGGEMIARGRLIGNAKDIRAHLECRSLIMVEGGKTLAVPELESSYPDVEMTHEAAVGKIARDQVEYLMARGLDEDKAVGMIVRGFLEGSIRGLPESLRKEINDVINMANLGH